MMILLLLEFDSERDETPTLAKGSLGLRELGVPGLNFLTLKSEPAGRQPLFLLLPPIVVPSCQS